MKMKYLFIAVSAIATLATLLSSCDTRDDYYYEHCDEPIVNFNWNKNDTTMDEEHSKFIIVDLNWGEEADIDFSFVDQYGEISDLSCVGTGGSNCSYYYDVNNGCFNEDHLSFSFDKQNRNIHIKELTKDAKDIYTFQKKKHPDSYIDLLNSFDTYAQMRLKLKIKNILGKEGFANLLLRIHDNRMPEPYIIVEDTENQLEKKITVKCTDPNEQILYYEYCINGEVCDNYGYGFDDKFNLNINAGDAAWNGTYITATRLSSINHAFQVFDGTNTIYVRCQDNWGCWSKWVKKNITIYRN